MKSGDQKLKTGKSVLEALRIERTDFNQKDFARVCGIPLKTYQRWVSGETTGRPTLKQLKALARNLNIKEIDELPDNFADKYECKG